MISLFHHLVGADKQHWRDGEAERPCDDVYLLVDELRRQARQSVEVDMCIAKFDGNVPTLDMAKVFKALAKGLQLFAPVAVPGEPAESQPILVRLALC